MSADLLPPYRPFSESPVDVPVQQPGRRLPVAERAPFQEPPAVEAQQPDPVDVLRRPAPGGMTFSSPERQG
ncbi:hypothetical protein [Kitasatospora sp. NBC_00315]|uniref:hypothetical protein n=1 Tax=Kitasatospora sp. NBC_00315 TaxID=2975963 RepID=UPI0032491AA8